MINLDETFIFKPLVTRLKKIKYFNYVLIFLNAISLMVLMGAFLELNWQLWRLSDIWQQIILILLILIWAIKIFMDLGSNYDYMKGILFTVLGIYIYFLVFY